MSFIFKRNILPMPRVQKSKRAGFTLLELIGVMVVISILLAVALPSAIDLIQVQRSVNERAELPKIAEALKRGMLREQVFPIYENDPSEATDASEVYWWNLAARHGGGSANEVRYPLGVRPGSDNTRHLYLADASWSGSTFFDIVSGNQLNWIQDPRDPSELRLLLLSTTSSGLPLPNTLTQVQFDNLWNDWAVGSDGNPATGSWNSYGLGNDWEGRAVELNVERIDLREWLCTVVIENRRAIEEASGAEFEDLDPQLSGTMLTDNWDSVYAYTVNQNGAEVVLSTQEATNGNGNTVTQVNRVVLSKRGRITNETLAGPASGLFDAIIVEGSKTTTSGTPPVSASAPATATIQLTLTARAPMALLNPNDSTNPSPLTGWSNADDYIQNRYFLTSQELLLGEPWNQTEIGIFTITEPFSTLRFDGLQWHY
ncbi:MAG: prepilin-type N-terminal cleavage/methylation domain-containing protein [Puniceicoccaceae bacterium]|nr:prepilin-type N-terminal cleavage/methylation domain-containing protein [Puniceicoccaceae bacterium]